MDAIPLGPFSDLLGLELLEVSGSRVRARWQVSEAVHQPFGLVHGGAHAAVVETVGSVAGNVWLDGKGRAVGVSNHTDFFRGVSAGTLDVTAVAVHQGRSGQVWQIDITDERERLIARGTLRLQNLYDSGAAAD
ncbi:MAG: PaaI family thioesterase [Actinomycetales bacterium]